MNIALCTDENFSIPALVCMTSIFENNKSERCNVYILTDSLSSNVCAKFYELAKVYGQKVEIITIDKQRFDGLIVNERFPISMYYRFLLPEMLIGESKVLYLDCDIIVRHSLSELYDTSLDGKALAAVVAQSCDDIIWTNQLKLNSPYFNSGVLLMNMDYWRQNDSFNKLVSWVANNPDKCMLPDQNALNVIFDGCVEYLDYTYNYQEAWFNVETTKIHYAKWNTIKEIGKDPIIIHYCQAEKPWFEECKNPFKAEWIKYANMHDFIDYRIQKRYNLEYRFAIIIDRIGLKFRYWSEKWQKKILAKIKVS